MFDTTHTLLGWGEQKNLSKRKSRTQTHMQVQRWYAQTKRGKKLLMIKGNKNILSILVRFEGNDGVQNKETRPV